MSQCTDTADCPNEATHNLPYARVCGDCFKKNLDSWNARNEEDRAMIRREWRQMGVANPFDY
jgi:hypothetical protein